MAPNRGRDANTNAQNEDVDLEKFEFTVSRKSASKKMQTDAFSPVTEETLQTPYTQRKVFVAHGHEEPSLREL